MARQVVFPAAPAADSAASTGGGVGGVFAPVVAGVAFWGKACFLDAAAVDPAAPTALAVAASGRRNPNGVHADAAELVLPFYIPLLLLLCFMVANGTLGSTRRTSGSACSSRSCSSGTDGGSCC